MSYLSFLRIQCSMGKGERNIIKYVMFGDRESMTQFPKAAAVEIDMESCEIAEFRPVFMFWDKTDEIMVRFYRQWAISGKKTLRRLSRAVKQHMQSKYKEVFLVCPETLLLSEQAEREIPHEFWEEIPRMQKSLLEPFARGTSLKILGGAEREVTVFLALDEECNYESLAEWLSKADHMAGLKMKDLFLLGDSGQKEKAEELLENFYEETGLAGSFCAVSECRRMVMSVGGEVLLVDERGLMTEQVGRPAYYIDGAGVRTRKEMKRLAGVCKGCYSLRMHLDRAFLSAL